MDILYEVATAIERYIQRGGGRLAIPPARLAHQLKQYITLRYDTGPLQISRPQHKIHYPVGWKKEYEVLWVDWVNLTYSMDGWAVMLSRVFGTNEYAWEVPGWREEIYTFLPWWIERNLEIVKEFDPMPEEEEEEEDSRDAKIDPYLLDHGLVRGH